MGSPSSCCPQSQWRKNTSLNYQKIIIGRLHYKGRSFRLQEFSFTSTTLAGCFFSGARPLHQFFSTAAITILTPSPQSECLKQPSSSNKYIFLNFHTVVLLSCQNYTRGKQNQLSDTSKCYCLNGAALLFWFDVQGNINFIDLLPL